MSGPPPGAQTQVEDDAEVVAQSLEQPELFARLYDRYAPGIHRYVARRLGDGMADDITADTFLTAFRIRGRYDRTHANARPWLYGIAGNLIGKHRRTEVRALKAPARTGHDPVAASWSETWVEQTDSRVAAQGPLAGAPAALPSGDRHVLLLVAWAELPDVSLVDHLVKDATGRRVIALSEGTASDRYRLIDPETYGVLGTQHIRGGKVIGGNALISRAVVDKAGERD
ncbi:sigma-70 family RNA polymerase sigma factor [Streptomyces europaeiscabiei]|uniref:RNA polymerase sigma factor n=1 Tax=Streptomyces europaeiscabiei TaxID=146819 RepID=UPI002E2BD8C1|nr:sigma-70 family RNA polymerase sigma factor [Streptomyces europaeiscabiei]